MVLYNSEQTCEKSTCFNCTVERPLRSLNETLMITPKRIPRCLLGGYGLARILDVVNK